MTTNEFIPAAGVAPHEATAHAFYPAAVYRPELDPRRNPDPDYSGDRAPDGGDWQDWDSDDLEPFSYPSDAELAEMYRHAERIAAQRETDEAPLSYEQTALWLTALQRGATGATRDFRAALHYSAAACNMTPVDYVGAVGLYPDDCERLARSMGWSATRYSDPSTVRRREAYAERKAARYVAAVNLKAARRETAPVADAAEPVATRPATSETTADAALPVRVVNVAQAATGTPHEAICEAQAVAAAETAPTIDPHEAIAAATRAMGALADQLSADFPHAAKRLRASWLYQLEELPRRLAWHAERGRSVETALADWQRSASHALRAKTRK